MTSIRRWLEELGLVQYADAFEANDIDSSLLTRLNDQALKDIGVTSTGHRLRMLRAIEGFPADKPAPTAQPIPERPPPRESIKAEAERRQLTVMFCDLVGSTALAEHLDPEELRDVMQAYQRACRGVVEKYDGHVAQYLGDGLMVYFGWPNAHEDDAVRAIRAGLETVEAVSKLTSSTPLRARVGIHTGLVVVGETGQGDASIPKAAVGETPNIAARLQALAESGTVLVSGRSRVLAEGLFDYADLGTQALKGVSDAMQLYKVVGARATDSRFDAAHGDVALTPLVGREEEVELLLRRWTQIKTGEGHLVLLCGEPGIGKSRITQVLRERISAEPHARLRFQCSPFHTHSALHPAIEQFERAAGFAREDTADEKLDKMEALLGEAEEEVKSVAPLFAALLSLPADRYPPLNLSPQKQKEKTLAALSAHVEALSVKRPVLMILEDAHWVDPTTQEAFELAVSRIAQHRILLVITYRPEYIPPWVGQPHVTSLTLNRLSRRQGTELVAKLTAGKALPAELLDQILAHTDGVPLFVEELTKSVLESSLLRDLGDHYILDAPLPALAIPTTLRDSLLARLDRLAPIREIVQIGACIGREFSYELLAAVSPLKGEPLDEALEQLTKTGLVFRRGTPPDAIYIFKHALVQDAAYDSLLKSKRAQLHAQIALVLEKDFSERVANEPELLAHHFTQAALHERAVPYWVLAGRRALSRVALAEAVDHLTRALSVNARLPASPDRDHRELDIRMLLGTAHLVHSGHESLDVRESLEPARDLAIRLGQDDKLVPILFYLWMNYTIPLDFARGLKVVEELDALARSSGDSYAFVVARNVECETHCWMGNFKLARQAADRGLLAYDPEKHGHLVHIYNHDQKCGILACAVHFLWILGYPDQAQQAAEEQVEQARRLGHAFNLSFSLTWGSMALIQRGETQSAQRWIAEADAIGKENAKLTVTKFSVPFFGGLALIAHGDHADGYAELTRAWRPADVSGGMLMTPLMQMMAATALIALERFEEAKGLLDAAAEVIERTGHRLHEAEVHRVLGELHRHRPTGDFHGAETSFLKAIDVARRQEAKGWELRAAMSLARLWQAQGKHQEARELLAPVYNWFTEGFDTRDLKSARALLEELSAP